MSTEGIFDSASSTVLDSIKQNYLMSGETKGDSSVFNKLWHFLPRWCCCCSLLWVCKLIGYVQGREIVTATEFPLQPFLAQKVLM